MPIDFRNTNTIWASVLVETLSRLGLQTAVICPGSRCAPLAVAFAAHPNIEAIPILDERSAAFFALGNARNTGLPVALACTSGTAGANFYPAIIEARESRIPLLILTADRPPQLRDCHAGQAIDQTRFYGNYPNWQAELAVPALDLRLFAYLRQTIVRAWDRSRLPTPGVVHLNCPFCDPLPPLPQPEAQALETQFPDDFFDFPTPVGAKHWVKNIEAKPENFHPNASPSDDENSLKNIELGDLFEVWKRVDRGIIIAGVAQPQHPETYCRAIAQLSQTLGFPVLAEGLSPVRNYAFLNPHLVSTYDILLRNPELSRELAPEIVIQIGDLPTSKELRTWLETIRSQVWVLDPSCHNLDPLHGKTIHVPVEIERLNISESVAARSTFLKRWCEVELKVRKEIARSMGEVEAILEPKIAWLLSEILPKSTPIWFANSMPVRDVEWFWKPNDRRIQPFFNRGANGIDGTLSSALGMTHRALPGVLLTGDLSFLHDTNGLLIQNKWNGHLTILLINNNGGGIFQMLPISQFDPPFEEFFATPQTVNFEKLCRAYNVEYEEITTWEQLKQKLDPLPQKGIRILELKTDRRLDTQWRQQHLLKLALKID
ncbi:MAG TPA: 2-succinyl-5-enolpyruvyl-6-hydroxy-3-cyclohexene-1-carboxylic-acid synthase [Oscillatoriales cyanobacterium M59_W2019_021]|nr:2-succinyl-5-enolpyruvyl-6-hydroxy-3-cyclohexene-1-carboxylic-acid synthase [Oscillatoriales cyanobacterium M59_W2019_021]